MRIDGNNNNMIRVGILAGTTISDFRLKTLEPILGDNQFSIEVCIIDGRPEPGIAKKIKKNLKRGRGGYIIVMALNRFFSKKSDDINTEEFCNIHKIDVIQTVKPYSQETIAKIKSYDLQLLILVGGFGIVKKPLLEVTAGGVLSYHHGNMRKYRGMPPGLWELYNGEEEMGVTVQILSPGLDDGIPVEEITVPIYKYDSVEKLQQRALDESVGMLYTALKKVTDRNFQPQRLEELGAVYTLPNLRQWIILNFRLFKRRLK